MTTSRRTVMVNGAAALAGCCGPWPAAAKSDPARALHQRLICLDTHLDTPASLARPGWNMMQRHSRAEDFTQVDYPRMVKGGLDGGFFAIYTPQGPLDAAGIAPFVEFGDFVVALLGYRIEPGKALPHRQRRVVVKEHADGRAG